MVHPTTAHQCGVEGQGALVALARPQLIMRHLAVPVPQPLKGLSLLRALLSSSVQQVLQAVLALAAV